MRKLAASINRKHPLAAPVIHALQSRGECELLAVTVTKDHPLAAAFVNCINHFYGRGGIPVGLVQGGVTPEIGKFIHLAQARNGGQLRYPNRYSSGTRAPDATAVLRAALAAQAPHSTAVVQVGFSTNLARLLDSPPDAVSELPGRALVAEKVSRLIVMAGDFKAGEPGREPIKEYNIVRDVASARKLVAEWPTPIDFSGAKIGAAIEYPSESIQRDYS